VDGSPGSFTFVEGVSPSGGGTISLTVAEDDTINDSAVTGDIDFPILNLVMLVPQSAASADYEPGDDPGAADLTNLEKYAFGLDPTVDGQSLPGLTGVGVSGEDFVFSYTRSRTANDVAFVIESTTDLTDPESWVPDLDVTEMMTGGDSMMETVEIQKAIGTDTQRFFRRKVEASSP
jgi:hypothetical protein